MTNLNESNSNNNPDQENSDSDKIIQHRFPNLQHISKKDIILNTQDDKDDKGEPNLLKEGQKLYQEKKFEQSKAIFSNIIKRNQDNILAHYYLSMIESHYKNWEHSLVHLNYIIPYIKSDKRLAQLNQLKAYILIIQKKYTEAETVLELLLKQLKSIHQPNALSMLGFIHYKAKNFKTAFSYYEKILSINKNHANGYNGIGLIYMERGDYKKGIEWCKKALKINPKSANYLDSIGYGYYKQGNESKAIHYFKLAYELDPENKEIKKHLNMSMEA